jgi:hypothetical protein
MIRKACSEVKPMLPKVPSESTAELFSAVRNCQAKAAE